jgi:hypothetical protein
MTSFPSLTGKELLSALKYEASLVNVDQKILTRLDELVALGQKVLATRRHPAAGHMTSDFVDVQLANQRFFFLFPIRLNRQIRW